MWPRTVVLRNARVVAEGGPATSLRFSSRVLDLDGKTDRSDVEVDVEGAFVLPGLVNAHDHLELNHFGRWKLRDRYENASDWIEDMRPRLRSDSRIQEGLRHSLADRLWIGALKNALSGVTTVAHHNPFYRELSRRFPIRVVRRYGWAHSFFLEGRPVGARGEPGPDVKRACRKTARGAPFFMHLAEGVDERARNELSRLEEIGGLGENTVLVHGVALTREDWGRVAARGAGLVWCPASNRYLFGKTAPVREFLDGAAEPGAIGLGTDSRLTGSRDLLEELLEARRTKAVSNAELLRMVTSSAARVLRVRDRGRIAVGLPADLVVVPAVGDDPLSSLVAAARSGLALVLVGGRPVVGSPGLAPVFEARRAGVCRGRLDGRERLFDASLARRARQCAIAEPGAELELKGRRPDSTK